MNIGAAQQFGDLIQVVGVFGILARIRKRRLLLQEEPGELGGKIGTVFFQISKRVQTIRQG